jgi:ABC-type Zn2+ transport system substrate-binding protein/surface adhesin
MKQSIYFLLFTFYFLLNQVDAQVDSSYHKIKDTIVVNKDPRLDILNQKQSLINKRSTMMTSNGMYKGYRLQLLNSNNRNAAFKLKYDLLTAYPDQKAYVSYQAPYFKVRFGNFLHRDEAEKMKKQLSKTYPKGVFVVEDAIEYTPKSDEDVK